ncbi:MAG: IclR family transcriptional regulator [Propionibacteriaceae bacterium]|jgi:DNA-binding IclR family transcriptional regulator|nr:IclR family transcriptional regulator [Propionibacteriaceae bacterium]
MTPKVDLDRAEAVKSAVRAVQMLEFLADRGGVPARPYEIAAGLNAPRSSAHALLRTLTAAGWVRADASGNAYTLGLRSLLVGTSFLDADPFVRLARPILSDLRDELGETVHLARLDRGRVIYLVTQESGRELRRFSRVGRWLPAHATSLGKAVLAARQDSPTGPLERLTEHTLTDPAQLAQDLEATRRRGYAIDDQEGTLGLRCVAVPLAYTDPVEDAISCSAPTDRMTPEHQERLSQALLRTARLLEDMAPLQGTI